MMAGWWRVVLAVAFATGVSSEKSSMVKLTKLNFDNNVKRGAWFVKFYAPWCMHCQKLAPIWEKLADRAVAKDWPVRIAEVDCTSSQDVCEKAQVKSYPMLALIVDGVHKGKYKGEASVSHFEDWLTSQQVLKSKPSNSEDKTGTSKSTASHATAVSAVISNFVARFPTQSKIMNIYIFGGTALSLLVALLCVLFRMFDAEDIAQEHEKEG
mmetsp:Transcript_92278/g.214391  ORF Transcript_92278/g.214391 Transcript_92278/m.214391 type:complete len:211 (+) Transcript_92278:112-744(+)|eukprot:CAMPEP_0171105662 /NCGR_PEP_ID=MMETSP0766_2-20121228/63170_1 /TAXON_ID=439317 /ORGANISM="Gambierdiscus australes, Strain CAWD 149" /LENGTH=210 /DNA_ID=CAMNT_0011566581 /DNA_START=101 /DNA_END=733 /DNA_ORIENTATION=-